MLARITLFATTLALATPVCAETPQSARAPEATVQYADLDLTTQDGMARLNRRIEGAAHALCPADPGLSELSRHHVSTRCVAETIARTDQRVAQAVETARMSRTAGRQVAAR